MIVDADLPHVGHPRVDALGEARLLGPLAQPGDERRVPVDGDEPTGQRGGEDQARGSAATAQLDRARASLELGHQRQRPGGGGHTAGCEPIERLEQLEHGCFDLGGRR